MKLQYLLVAFLSVSALMVSRDDNKTPDGRTFVYIHRSSFVPLRNKVMGSDDQDRFRCYFAVVSSEARPKISWSDRAMIEYAQARYGFFVERFIGQADDSAHVQYRWREAVFVCSRSEEVLEDFIRTTVQRQQKNLIGLTEHVMNNIVIAKPVDGNLVIIAAERCDKGTIPSYSAEEKLKIGFELYELQKKGKPGLFVVGGRRVKVTNWPKGSHVSYLDLIPSESKDEKK